MEVNNKKIGRNIKAIRNANKKSYIDFADEIAISDSYLEKLENGTRPASDELIQTIAKNTGFSFNDIKYGDLSCLEKGELSFDNDITIDNLNNDTEYIEVATELYKECFICQFPIVEDDTSSNNADFQKGLVIVRKKIQELDCSPQECVDAINHFIRASKHEGCADYSYINILSCFGYLYLFHMCAAADVSPKGTAETVKINSLSKFLSTVNSLINHQKLDGIKNAFLEKYNGLLTTFMKSLAESEKNSDYAYYYLCLRYLMGMMDEKITLLDTNQMRIFGESMLDSLCKMGNKYAISLYNLSTQD